MLKMELVKYRRQYIVSPNRIESLEHWQTEKIANYFIYAEKSLELNKVSNDILEIVLLGYVIDPHNPEKSNSQIIEYALNRVENIESIAQFLYSLSGRFVLIINLKNNIYVYNDASGYRTVFYSFNNDKEVVSHPSSFMEK